MKKQQQFNQVKKNKVMGKYSKGDKVTIQNKGMHDHESKSRVGNNGGSKSATVTKVFDHGVRTDKGYYGFKSGISKSED